jgi:hypothetical protein
MGLFGRKGHTNLKSACEMVEKVISDLGLDPEENRLQTEDESVAWGLMRGSAQVFIFVKPADEDEGESFETLQIVAPVMKVPESGGNVTALYQRLLELNAQELTGVAFGLKGDTVVITTDRSTEDLDRSEVKEMILRVGYFADLYDDALVNQFGGNRFSD